MKLWTPPSLASIVSALGFTPANRALTPQVLGNGNGATVSSGTSEVSLADVAVPAMGEDDALLVTTLWLWTNSANNKTLRVRYGGLAGTQIFGTNVTTTVHGAFQQRIANYGATNAQRMFNSSAPFGTTAGAIFTSTFQTNAGFTLSLTGQPANAGESIELINYCVELYRGV